MEDAPAGLTSRDIGRGIRTSRPTFANPYNSASRTRFGRPNWSVERVPDAAGRGRGCWASRFVSTVVSFAEDVIDVIGR